MRNACIACGFHLTHELYHPADQPLSVLNLPRTRQEARNALRFPMNFRVCANCGHIFNVDFDYYHIPYENDSNLMYNKAKMWGDHLNGLVERLVNDYGAKGKTLVDIGCGDGEFFKILLDRNLGNRCVGFEPGPEAHNAEKNGLEVYRDYFIGKRDLPRIRPDFLVCRHVIEHMDNPRQFVSEIAYWCNICGVFPLFVAEVPRIDNAIAQGRINDFLYEHPSNFTEFSFRNMFEASGYQVLDVQAEYGDEVVVLVGRPHKSQRPANVAESTKRYRQRLKGQRETVAKALSDLQSEGKRIAIWGATGKGAAFLNTFAFSGEQFSLVVDSDHAKVGRFVAGTAQQIRPPEDLLENPADVIVITTQWRAMDIAHEIRARKIPHERILVVRNGELCPLGGTDS